MPVLQELLAHQDFVRRLARHLVGDEHRAADVAQEVWVRALEKPPRQRTALQGWLARVTRNVASNTVRGERRRLHYEGKKAQPEPVARVEAARRELALQHTVVEAVQSLEEPYRATILLRYFEELPRAQIAAELDISIATVSTRLQRGLAKLRQRLDRAHGGDRGTWTRGLVLLLAKDASPPVLPIGGEWLGGGTTLTTMAKIGAVLVVLAGVGWWLRGWFGDDSEPSGTEVVAEDSSEAVARPLSNAGAESHEVENGESRHPVPADSAPDEPPRRPGSSLAAGWALMGKVHGLTKEELRDVQLSVSSIPAAGGPIPMPRPVDFQGPPHVAIDDEGYFEIELTEALRARTSMELAGYFLMAQHPDFRSFTARVFPDAAQRPRHHPVDPSPPIVLWVDVELLPAVFLTGRVVYDDDRPAQGGGAVAYRLRDGVPEPVESANAPCAPDGSFVLRVPGSGEYAVMGISGKKISCTEIARVDLEETYDFAAPFVLAEWEEIEGRVVGLEAPRDNCRVVVRMVGDEPAVRGANPGDRGFDDHELVWQDRGFVPTVRNRVTPNADGSFLLGDLGRETPFALQLIPPPRFLTVPGTPPGEAVEVEAPAAGVELRPGWAVLQLRPTPPLDPTSWGILTVNGEFGTMVQGFAGPRGMPPLACAPGEGLHVRLECPGRVSWEGAVVAPDVGEVKEETIELPAGGAFASLELEVVMKGVGPVERVGIELRTRDDDAARGLLRGVAPVVDGVALIEGLIPGEFDVIVRAPVHGSWLVSSCGNTPCPVTLVPGAKTRHRVEFEDGGRLSLAAHDPRGAPLGPVVEMRDAEGRLLDVEYVTYWQGQVSHYTRGRLTGGGAATTSLSLIPGDYELRFVLDGYAPRTVRVTAASETITTVDVELEPAPPGEGPALDR